MREEPDEIERSPSECKMSRRSFLKASAAATAAPLIITSRKSGASDEDSSPPLPPSPSTAGYEWTVDLPVRSALAPRSFLNPEPTEQANIAGGECGRGPHPNWASLYPNAVDYEIHVREAPHTFTAAPGIPPQPIWGYDGLYPGPTIHGRYGTPAIVRIYNDLPQNHVGFGSPEISTHLHNLHTPSESDGFPGDFYSPGLAGPTLTSPGSFKDHCYPNVRAGYEQFPDTFGDPNESLGTLWFHDHTMDSTAANVYKGLAGFCLMFDELDSGNENDPNPAALRLPSGAYDIPMVIQDKRFTPDGELFWDQLSPEGVLGDKFLVNGVIQPKLQVEQRKYRLRFLNGGPTRSYELYFYRRNSTALLPFIYIANDGNLLTAPLSSLSLRNATGASPHGMYIGVAERHDIVFDFSRYPVGTEILLVNRLNQLTTRKPENTLLTINAINSDPTLKGHQLLLFKVVPRQGVDNSRVPTALRPMTPTPTDLSNIPVRSWTFTRNSGVWVINNQIFNVNSPRATIAKGSAEIWELRNDLDNGWTHPLHIHFEEGRILSRTDINGVNLIVPPQERGRKDVYVLHPGHKVRVFLRFRDFPGKYPMHCHNLAHEDHAMMLRWDIV